MAGFQPIIWYQGHPARRGCQELQPILSHVQCFWPENPKKRILDLKESKRCNGTNSCDFNCSGPPSSWRFHGLPELTEQNMGISQNGDGRETLLGIFSPSTILRNIHINIICLIKDDETCMVNSYLVLATWALKYCFPNFWGHCFL